MKPPAATINGASTAHHSLLSGASQGSNDGGHTAAMSGPKNSLYAQRFTRVFAMNITKSQTDNGMIGYVTPFTVRSQKNRHNHLGSASLSCGLRRQTSATATLMPRSAFISGV
ncbi:hypothetical protein Vafri_16774 [Volvox africanus]|uniref:Uncharacterized protein n=1 Tax=Volvox africanus TaxID=51714 RepID=A0A8J4F6V1_9CHLO|nr:hypothetical protein Vafri_16774 [Volvox africanus]